LEQEGVSISTASEVYQKLKAEKTRRGKRRKSSKYQVASSKQNEESVDPYKDLIRALDVALLERTGKTPVDNSFSVSIPIQIKPHDPSPYQLSIQEAPEETMVMEEADGALRRVAQGEGEHLIPVWVAPFEPPPSFERMLGEVHDLVIEQIDPELFWKQFTPGDADVAYRKKYGWWSRLTSPFLKWERKVEHLAHEVKEEEEELITQAEETWHTPVLVPRLHLTRVFVGFLGLLVLVSLPAGAVSLSRSFGSSLREIKDHSQIALSDVRTAIQATGSDQARALDNASARFRAADEALSRVNILAVAAAQALPETRELYQSARALLTAGNKASEAGRLLSQGLSRAIDQSTLHPDERLITFLTYLDSATPFLDEALENINSVKTERLPEDIQPQMEALKASLVTGRSSLQDVQAISHVLLDLIGHDRPRTYLFVFQNQTEIRPTGGFIGSLAEVQMDRGEIKKVHVPGGGPYDFRNQLMARVVPPKPIQLISTRWEFQDANWFPDFPASARKIQWFWSKSGQPTLDGVIAVNATMMQKLLAITGPIEMPEYGKTITAENFLLETQKAVELEYDREENKPKKFIGDLMPKLLTRVKNSSRDEWFTYLAVLTQALETKEVQVYLSNAEEEAIVEKYGWSGQMRPVTGDTLAVIGANIAGQKTDAVIREQVQHQAIVAEDGSITDEVTIIRTHEGKKGEVFRGANNVTYLRVYVPQGSELIEASGFHPPLATFFKQPLAEDPEDQDLKRFIQQERVSAMSPDVTITEEFGRTAFGAWIQLEPGETSVTRFRYTLPFTVMDLARELGSSGEHAQPRAAYTMLLTSQSGKNDRTIETHIRIPSSWKNIWMKGASTSTEGLLLDGIWDRDQVFGALFELPYGETTKTQP